MFSNVRCCQLTFFGQAIHCPIGQVDANQKPSCRRFCRHRRQRRRRRRRWRLDCGPFNLRLKSIVGLFYWPVMAKVCEWRTLSLAVSPLYPLDLIDRYQKLFYELFSFCLSCTLTPPPHTPPHTLHTHPTHTPKHTHSHKHARTMAFTI